MYAVQFLIIFELLAMVPDIQCIVELNIFFHLMSSGSFTFES